MTDKYFLDTNILIYTLDTYDRNKQDKARVLLQRASRTKNLVVSTQVLQEFYVTATKKLGVDAGITKQLVQGFTGFETVTVTIDVIMQAIDASTVYQLSFWDSLIVAAALSANCSELWSEDLNDGQNIQGMKIVNPLRHYDDILPRFE